MTSLIWKEGLLDVFLQFLPFFALNTFPTYSARLPDIMQTKQQTIWTEGASLWIRQMPTDFLKFTLATEELQISTHAQTTHKVWKSVYSKYTNPSSAI